MKINLHIDQIVIEGISLTRRERDQLASTLEQELARQLRQRRRPPGAASEPGALPQPARRDRDGSAQAPLGARIAHELLAALPASALAGGQPLGSLPATRRRAAP
jgi:hypothetical protein